MEKSNFSDHRVKLSWSPDEDQLLQQHIKQHGPRNWRLISDLIPGRSGKACRFRWCNQLSPEIEHSPFAPEEDEIIVNAQAKYGNKWATISRLMKGRTDNAIKNRWNSTLKRKQSAERALEQELQPPPPQKKLLATASFSGLSPSPSSVSYSGFPLYEQRDEEADNHNDYVSTELTLWLPMTKASREELPEEEEEEKTATCKLM